MEEWGIVIFVSRNKDNKQIKGFKRREKTFLLNTFDFRDFDDKFLDFVKNGIENELCRFYVSANSRNMEKVKKSILHKIIDMDYKQLAKGIDSKLISVAMKPECAETKYWLLDIDTKDENVLYEISDYVEAIGCEIIDTRDTVNGFHVVIDKGFDSRKLIEQYKEVLKIHKDGLLLYDWKINNLTDE